MVPDINFLLIGNSRLHWAKYSKNQSKFFHTKKEEKVPENIDLDQLIWASVGKLPNFLLKKENEIKTKDINLSNLPDYFGIDRALACLAAQKIIENPLKKDLLIADFGTILSITKLNSNGSIIGGQLTPGFLTQLKSMEQNTKNLTVPKKYDIPIKDFLINTEEAILKGVINSLTGVIHSLFNSEKDILVICGGDSELLTKSLKTQKENIINAPDLVMEGMIIHHLSIKN
ncbi:MAG: type III pantothenate kinase [Prochlorococcus marinus XMU1425]|nr:type III pantothenate kinase [Prochlorococcus marinus XMU1425]MCR8534731.1 type III pantothenate kinase [Prochlorococcus marinus XMU1426]